MRLEQLDYLRTVAKTKSINKASEQLYVSHQAISTALQNLENELGVCLYTRTNRGISLTADGLYVLDVANQIATIIEDIYNHFSYTKTISPSSFCIGATSSIYNQNLAEVLIDYYIHYRDIPLKLVTDHGGNIISKVADGIIDLGFICHSVYKGLTLTVPIPEELLFIPISQFQYTLVCSPFSDLAQFPSVSFNQILQYPVIFAEHFAPDNISDYPPYQVLRYFGEVKLLPKAITVALNTIIMQNTAVSIASTIDTQFIIPESKTIRIPIEEPVQNYIGMIFHKDAIKNPLVQFFMNSMCDSKQIPSPNISHKKAVTSPASNN